MTPVRTHDSTLTPEFSTASATRASTSSFFEKCQAEVELPPYDIRHLQQYTPRPSIDEEHHRELAAFYCFIVDELHLLEGSEAVGLLSMNRLEHERRRL